MKIRSIKTILNIIAILFFTILINSCSDDSVTAPPPAAVTDNLILLDQQYATGARALVYFYVEETLKVGYNKIYIVLKDSVTMATINNSHVEFEVTGHGGVGIPVENPDENAVNGKFVGAMVLTQSQSSSFGENLPHWHYHIHVHNHEAPGEPEGEAEFGDFRVLENDDTFRSITMPDSTKLFLSNIKPVNPVSGMNSFEFLISRNSKGYEPDGAYTIQMTPVHISDGHTSSGNVNPVGESDGHYNGTINFDRSGEWRINLKLIRDTISYDTFFEMNY